jgi:hypothetical protein
MGDAPAVTPVKVDEHSLRVTGFVPQLRDDGFVVLLVQESVFAIAPKACLLHTSILKHLAALVLYAESQHELTALGMAPQERAPGSVNGAPAQLGLIGGGR